MLNYRYPAIIHNPAAAGGKAKRRFKIYYDKLVKSGIFEKIDIFETSTKDQALTTIENICNNQKNDLIISIGGDGTISTTINGIMRAKKEYRLPLFPLPSGSGNSLLRDFGITSVDKAIKNYQKLQKSRLYDIFLTEEINGSFKWYCINIIGMGFISDIADYAVRNGKKFGALTYMVALFSVLGRFRPYKVKLIYGKDRNVIENNKTYFLTISNTKYTGGAIKIAPDAMFDDGLMDVVYLHDLNRFEFLYGFLQTFRGGHLKMKKICSTVKTEYLEIEATPQFLTLPDGDLVGNTPLRVTLLPKEIELIV